MKQQRSEDIIKLQDERKQRLSGVAALAKPSEETAVNIQSLAQRRNKEDLKPPSRSNSIMSSKSIGKMSVSSVDTTSAVRGSDLEEEEEEEGVEGHDFSSHASSSDVDDPLYSHERSLHDIIVDLAR